MGLNLAEAPWILTVLSVLCQILKGECCTWSVWRIILNSGKIEDILVGSRAIVLRGWKPLPPFPSSCKWGKTSNKLLEVSQALQKGKALADGRGLSRSLSSAGLVSLPWYLQAECLVSRLLVPVHHSKVPAFGVMGAFPLCGKESVCCLFPHESGVCWGTDRPEPAPQTLPLSVLPEQPSSRIVYFWITANGLQHPKSTREKQGFWEFTKCVHSSVFFFLVAFFNYAVTWQI